MEGRNISVQAYRTWVISFVYMYNFYYIKTYRRHILTLEVNALVCWTQTSACGAWVSLRRGRIIMFMTFKGNSVSHTCHESSIDLSRMKKKNIKKRISFNWSWKNVHKSRVSTSFPFVLKNRIHNIITLRIYSNRYFKCTYKTFQSNWCSSEVLKTI